MDVGFATRQGLEEAYDQRIAEAVQRLKSAYHDEPTLVQEFRHILERWLDLSAW